MIAKVHLWGRSIGAVALDKGREGVAFQYDPQFARSGIEIPSMSKPTVHHPFIANHSYRSFHLIIPRVLTICLLSYLPTLTLLKADDKVAVEMEARARQLGEVASIEKNPKKPGNNPWLAVWHLSHGNTERGLKMLYGGLDGTNPKHQGHPFSSYVFAYAYMKYGHLFDANHVARWKELVQGREPYSYNLLPYPNNYSTTNLRLVGMTTWYLASITLGMENLPQGHIPNDGDPTRVHALHKAIDKIGRTGVPEYASRPYCVVNMVPLLCLSEQKADPELARKAAVVYEAALETVAPNWLRGLWVVATGRSYGDLLSQSSNSNINFLWMYFGGLPDDAQVGGLPAAAMTYRPPSFLVNIANSKSEPFVATSRISWVKSDNPVVELNPPYFLQYAYFNKTYGIYSQITAPGATLPEQQIYPNGVMWEDASQAVSCLWATIPAPAYAHTAGQIEQGLEFIQKEGAWLMVGKPQKIEKFQFIQTFIPGGWEAMVDDAAKDGRVYLAYKSVLIALSLPKPFTWYPNRPYHHPAEKPPAMDAGHRGFAYAEKPLAMAIDTMQPEQATGATPQQKLAWFREKVRSSTGITMDGETARYKTLGEHLLERAPGSQGLVDGKVFDVERQPFLKNPWMDQPYQQDMKEPCKLTVSYAGKTHIYDLKDYKITHHDGPASPTHLIARLHSGRVELSWTPGPGEPTEYHIKRSNGDAVVEVGKSPSPKWTDASAADGKAYTYAVTAVNAGGESPQSLPVTVTPGSGIPTNPAGLVTTAGDARVELSWKPSTGATGYKIFRSTSPGGPYQPVGTSTAPHLVDFTVRNHTSYWYVVTATGPSGESGYSNEDMVLARQGQLSSPTGVKVSRTQMEVDGKTVPAIKVTWSPVPGALQYNVGLSNMESSLFVNRGSNSEGKTEWIYPEDDIIKKGGPWCKISVVNSSGGANSSAPVHLFQSLKP